MDAVNIDSFFASGHSISQKILPPLHYNLHDSICNWLLLMDHLCWKLRILVNINNLTAEIQKIKRIDIEIALNKSKKTNTLPKIMAYNNIISIT